MGDERIERQLKDFLDWEEQKRREGKTLDAVFDRLDQLAEEQKSAREERATVMGMLKRIAKDRLVDKHRGETHGRAIKTLQAQVQLLTQRDPHVPNWQPDQDEITGVHTQKAIQRAVADLEEKFEEEQERKREETTWWRRQGWIWAFAVITLVVGSALSGCVQLIIHRVDKVEQRK